MSGGIGLHELIPMAGDKPEDSAFPWAVMQVTFRV